MPNKTLIFELKGGPYDGTYRSDSPQLGESALVQGFYLMSRYGTIGTVLHGLAAGERASNHGYQVVERRDLGPEIRVTCRHVLDA